MPQTAQAGLVVLYYVSLPLVAEAEECSYFFHP